MSSQPASSNIKVSVQWKRAAVFSGEDLECTISFTNILLDSTTSHTSNVPPDSALRSPDVEGSSSRPIVNESQSSLPPNFQLSRSLTPTSPRLHSASLSVGALQNPLPPVPSTLLSPNLSQEGPDSLSRDVLSQSSKISHTRPNSINVLSRAGPSDSSTHPTQLPNTILSSSCGSRPQNNKPLSNFQFPNKPSNEPLPISRVTVPRQPRHFRPDSTSPSQTSHARSISHSTAMNNSARPLVGNSLAGTPRSSVDWRDHAGSLSETIASDYQIPSLTNPDDAGSLQSAQVVSLMMGYAQLSGSFVVDGAIMNSDSFQAVREKGVVGGQGGGGVVGVHRSRARSGTFGFSWDALNEGIGALLKPKQMSSLDEMQEIADNSGIPIIATPQSLLFVDLQLSPGESKRYSYRIKLPRTLPPTHRGRSIKITYKLMISTHRRTGRDQIIHSIEVPFRVLGGVDYNGDVPQYDLFNPLVLLHDIAQISPINSLGDFPAMPSIPELPANKLTLPDSNQEGFFDYVSTLLNRPRHSQAPLLSPTRHRSLDSLVAKDQIRPRDLIDRAISNSTFSIAGQSRGTHQFKISRDNYKVAIITLSRPFYRLGEDVVLTIDFDGADIPCLYVELSLESSEVVDPVLALRSPSNIHRVTRKVWDSVSRVVIYNQRTTFSPTISRNGTPEFATTGVNHKWVIHVEFVIPRINRDVGMDPGSEVISTKDQVTSSLHLGHIPDSDDSPCQPFRVLYDLVNDSGNVAAAAVKRIGCESFEVDVPIRVYGDNDPLDSHTIIEQVV